MLCFVITLVCCVVVVYFFWWRIDFDFEDEHTCSICQERTKCLTHKEMLKHAEMYHYNQLSHIITEAYSDIKEIMSCKGSKNFCTKRVYNSVVLWDMVTPINANVLMDLSNEIPDCILRITMVIVRERVKYETWENFAKYGNFNNVLLAYCFPRSKETLYTPEEIPRDEYKMDKTVLSYDDVWKHSWEDAGLE